ncbi:hypothetical protein SteCoe_33082 [Stentor coeruleus]|uniref:Uncharacterized protein n=1 Tax=Stentor coeruleus TaxID=5963 RepID=A0A1R2AXK2_9CILI|nr:hypothetical protein SteCoe_33082 [Stentor coeruleus]
MEQTHVIRALINDVKGNIVFIKLSCEGLTKSFNKEAIKFRSLPAPSSLIVKNASVLIKIQGKHILEVAINPNIKLEVYFGSLKSFNNEKQVVNVSDNLQEYEALSNQIYEKGKVINLKELPNMMNKPALIFFNNDSLFEVRIIDEGSFYKYKLQAFEVIGEKYKNTTFILMKDDTNTIFHIHKEFVFFKGSNIGNLKLEEIKALEGKNVFVTIKNKIIRAEIDLIYTEESKCKNHTLNLQEDDESDFCENITRSKSLKENSEQNDIFEHKNDRVRNTNISEISSLPTSDHDQSQSYNAVENIESEKTQTCIKRTFFENFNEMNLKWYFLDNPNKPYYWNLFIGLCETIIRFPKSGVCNVFKKKLSDMMNASYYSEFEKYFDYLISLGNTKLNHQIIELLYSFLESNYPFFEQYAQLMLNNIDLMTIADNYNVCINLYSQGNNELNNNFYKPKTPEEFYPIISLFIYDQAFHLIYPEQIMEYDGYNLATMQISPNKSISLEWPLVYKERPEYLKLLDGILELHKYIHDNCKSTEDFRASNEKIIKAIESNESQINSWDTEEYENLKAKIKGHMGN